MSYDTEAYEALNIAKTHVRTALKYLNDIVVLKIHGGQLDFDKDYLDKIKKAYVAVLDARDLLDD